MISDPMQSPAPLQGRPDGMGVTLGYGTLAFFFGLFLHTMMTWVGNVGLVGEGVAVVGAHRVLEGEIPYRDFWTIYAPGSFYLLAGVFSVFDSHLLAARLTSGALYALASLAVYGIGVRSMRPLYACALSCLVSFALYPTSNSYSTYSPVLPCLVASLYATTVYFRSHSRRALLLAGVACSFAICFKHDVGGYVAVATMATLIIRRLHAPSSEVESTLLKEVWWFALGCASVSVPVYAALWVAAGNVMWVDLVVFPLTDFPASRPERYPSPIPDWRLLTSFAESVKELSTRIRFTMPAIVFVSSILWLAWRRRVLPSERFAAEALLVLCLPFFWNAAHVQINTHILTMTVLCALIVGRHAAVWSQGSSQSGLKRWVLLGGLSVCVAAWFVEPAYRLFQNIRQPYDMAAIGLPRARHIQTFRAYAQELYTLVDAINEVAAPGEAVFVGLHRHDVVVVNPTLLYFLLERPVPTRYHEMHSAIADTDPIQREIIAELESIPVRTAILWRGFEDEVLDRALKGKRREALPNRGAKRLDQYFQAKFQAVRAIGAYEIWQRL